MPIPSSAFFFPSVFPLFPAQEFFHAGQKIWTKLWREEKRRGTHTQTHTEVQVDDRLKSLKHNIYTAAKQTKSVLYCPRDGKIMESSGFTQRWEVVRVRFWRRLWESMCVWFQGSGAERAETARKESVLKQTESLRNKNPPTPPPPLWLLFLCCCFTLWRVQCTWRKDQMCVCEDPFGHFTFQNPLNHSTSGLLRHSHFSLCMHLCVWCLTFVFTRQGFGRHRGLNHRRLHCELKLSPLMEATVVVVEVAGVLPLVGELRAASNTPVKHFTQCRAFG